ncbi:glycosyltransferase family 2 protein [Clostridium saccharoperbutylacetonicum]|uniref:glycosyltransferase family 2 protein n=1 Tax=Clostridium saccharoperbutylacetonicum TaxID=36745 RepID=UPI000983FDFD|nr:glycosyltransferase [Clostridium saccharoperbutylacetonicum]AQR96931.1 putative glycosyltransferase EpsH [Clostridium saccharoperbutylacetonicum]
MIKVSIIVPVHNSEIYLHKCLDSLVNQSLEEIEIILINDNSTDESINILQEYKNRYPNKIILIDLKEIQGPGGARNEGLNIASGQYIGFVDSDDYVEIEMFEELYNLAISGNYDMVDCCFENKRVEKFALSTTENTWGKLNIEKRRQLIAYPGFLWSKIIKRNILIDNHIRFREKVTYEDMDFLPVVMLYLKSVYATDLLLYYYENNLHSITNSYEKDIQIKDKMAALKALVEKFNELNAYEDYKEEITFQVYNTYMHMVKFCTFYLDDNEVNYSIYKELQEFFFKLVNHDYKNNKYIAKLDKKNRMYADLNNIDYRIILDTYHEQ